ncbi:MAG: InlB B-repeat-containing protein [Kofleriaceae bacterium]
MIRISLVVVAASIVACGDDGNTNKLPDAPVVLDAMIDGPPEDAPVIPPTDVELGVTTSGNGSGRITSTPAGIDCGSTCDASFEEGTMITLTAEPDPSSVFTGWGGACSGATPVCEVTVDASTSVTATFTLKTYAVTVTKAGTGDGTVAGNGLNCGVGAGCTITVDHGTMISLTATPVALNNFIGWGGACTGTGTCDLTITADTAISAAFALDDLSLIVTRGGNGAGTITSAPAGINCPGTCSFVFQANQMVTLTAAPAGSSTFTGWGLPCSGTGTCVVTMDAAKTVTGTFTLKSYVLDVTKTGSTGTGTVSSDPGGIACGSDCNEAYNHGSVVELSAAPSASSNFTGWSGGGCTGNAPTCDVTVTAATTVNAQFTIKSYALTTSSTSGGSISSTPAGITCPGDCSQNYNHGVTVMLTATEEPGYTFTSWGGDCSGTGACNVNMTQARNVTATFTINSYDLDVTVTGMGTVTHAGNISCPDDCQGTYTHGTDVTLTQMAGTGYTFTGWGGACTGIGACVVDMTQAQAVTATFTINSYTLTAAIAGSGTGVVSAPNISCPSDCSESFTHGTDVTVTQVPNGDSNFSNWSGACTGTGACVIDMTSAQTVTANYTIKSYNLDVTVVGTGTVTGPQISCGNDCQGTYTHGTDVTLTQSAGSGFQFTGWMGACTGMGACVVDMTMAQSVRATFTPLYTLQVDKNGNGTGTVVSMPAGTINCGGDCNETALAGASYVLVATPTTPGSEFAGWSGGGCSGMGTCSTTPAGNTTVIATFNKTKHVLTATVTGIGTIDSSPSGISNCAAGSGTCSATFDYNTTVTLTATPGGSGSTASEHVAWGGACAGTPVGTQCTVTVTAATSVTATFALAPNIIFATSRAYAVSEIGGFSGAADLCNAEAGQLVGDGPKQNTKFVAFLSDTPQVDFKTRLANLNANASGWRRPDGAAVFNTLGDLANSVVFYPPRWDRSRDLIGPPTSVSAPRVWTGSNADGTYAGSCSTLIVGTVPIFVYWGGGNPQGAGVYGLASASSSMAVNTDVQNCATTTARLLCLGYDRAASVDAAPSSGRLAFTSTANFNINSMGIAQADAICKAESTVAGLPGNFLALLSTDTRPAISRFDLDRPTWIRVSDKLPIVARAADLANDALTNLITAPNSNANGSVRFGKTINWSGSTLPLTLGSGVSCDSWTAQGKSKAGYAGDTSLSVWWDYPPFSGGSCTQENRKIVCLQE